MDPYVNTRLEYTENSLEVPIFSEAAPEWKKYGENLQDLYRKLAFHPAMEPNMNQTYMTPAASKNKGYFMWDFIGRTLSYLYQSPPDLDFETPSEREKWEDVISRSTLASSLILDTNCGMLDMMVAGTYPDQQGRHPELGAEILESARKLSA